MVPSAVIKQAQVNVKVTFQMCFCALVELWLLTARYSMVYIAKEAWPEKKDFLKQKVDKRCQTLHINFGKPHL